MLMSEAIKKTIQTEVKNLKNLKKILQKHATSYGVTNDNEIKNIDSSIEYYEKVLAEKD